MVKYSRQQGQIAEFLRLSPQSGAYSRDLLGEKSVPDIPCGSVEEGHGYKWLVYNYLLYDKKCLLTGFCAMAINKVAAVLVDLSGTIHIDDAEIPGSIKALER